MSLVFRPDWNTNNPNQGIVNDLMDLTAEIILNMMTEAHTSNAFRDQRVLNLVGDALSNEPNVTATVIKGAHQDQEEGGGIHVHMTIASRALTFHLYILTTNGRRPYFSKVSAIVRGNHRMEFPRNSPAPADQ